MKTNKPIARGDEIFDKVALSLIVSPLVQEGFVSSRAVINLEYYRIDEAGQVKFLDDPANHTEVKTRRTLIFSDVFANEDTRVLTALGTMEYALQEYLNQMNY